jgi:hypothetical protein
MDESKSFPHFRYIGLFFIVVCLVPHLLNGGSITSSNSPSDSSSDTIPKQSHSDRKLSISDWLKSDGVFSGFGKILPGRDSIAVSNTTSDTAHTHIGSFTRSGGGSDAASDSSTSNANTISSFNSSHGLLSREQCFAKYGKRAFFKPSERRLPPMLYTFPGSGNTWARLLIEYSTNVYTGSVYNDPTLLKALPGEYKCNWEVSVVKVHPHTHPFEGLRTGKFFSDSGKCKSGGINNAGKGFDKAILLIRDPYDSIWSECVPTTTQINQS